MKYAGIGSRETPHETMLIMSEVAHALADQRWTLRTGGAEGADDAFASGIRWCQSEFLEMYLPWRDYNGWHDEEGEWGDAILMETPEDEAYDLAAQYHPAWDRLKGSATALHARNMHIMLGRKLDDPVDLVICWTPDAKVAGGTGQALRVALDLGIPIRNLANEAHREVILDALESDNWNEI